MIWLMLVLCVQGAPDCKVTWSHARYEGFEQCMSAARGLISAAGPYGLYRGQLRGTFCEVSERKPDTYRIAEKDLPQ